MREDQYEHGHVKCAECGASFPLSWVGKGAIKDENGYFCGIRCQKIFLVTHTHGNELLHPRQVAHDSPPFPHEAWQEQLELFQKGGDFLSRR